MTEGCCASYGDEQAAGQGSKWPGDVRCADKSANLQLRFTDERGKLRYRIFEGSV